MMNISVVIGFCLLIIAIRSMEWKSLLGGVSARILE